mgnify:CR=1 FL=1|jgi:AbrB family looped-hinge helix DNA binding protein
MTEQEQIEDVIKVSSKGQIVIPREIRKRLGVKGGEKLLVLTRDGDILLRKVKGLSLEEAGERIDRILKEEDIDVDKLVAEAVEWARKSK